MATVAIPKCTKKQFDAPDEMRPFSNGRIDLVYCGDTTIGRVTLQPGWKWSNDMKPQAKTEYCRSMHTQYVLSGRLRVQTEDGFQCEYGPGDVAYIQPDHDAWVLGSEPFVAIDFTGAKDYAKPQQEQRGREEELPQDEFYAE